MTTSLTTLVVKESGRAVNEVDLALQPEIRVLEPAFGVRRIDGAVVILGEKFSPQPLSGVLKPSPFGGFASRNSTMVWRPTRYLVSRTSRSTPRRNGSTSSRMTAATSSSVSVVMVSGWET